MAASSKTIYDTCYRMAMGRAPVGVLGVEGVTWYGYGLTIDEIGKAFLSRGWAADDHHSRWMHAIDSWIDYGLMTRKGSIYFLIPRDGDRTRALSRMDSAIATTQDQAIIGARMSGRPIVYIDAHRATDYASERGIPLVEVEP